MTIRRSKMKTPDEIKREAQELENELRSGGKNFFDVLVKAANLSREAERTEAEMRKPYYDICPDCGAHLDPGEHCDCEGRNRMVDSAEIMKKEASSGEDGNKGRQAHPGRALR